MSQARNQFQQNGVFFFSLGRFPFFAFVGPRMLKSIAKVCYKILNRKKINL